MNPFNDSPLTAGELQQDCLCYMSYEGLAMKASRLFAGYEHDREVRRLADFFQCAPAAAAGVRFDRECVTALRATAVQQTSVFGERDLKGFGSCEEAYHGLLMDIMDQQVRSTDLVLPSTNPRDRRDCRFRTFRACRGTRSAALER